MVYCNVLVFTGDGSDIFLMSWHHISNMIKHSQGILLDEIVKQWSLRKVFLLHGKTNRLMYQGSIEILSWANWGIFLLWKLKPAFKCLQISFSCLMNDFICRRKFESYLWYKNYSLSQIKTHLGVPVVLNLQQKN